MRASAVVVLLLLLAAPTQAFGPGDDHEVVSDPAAAAFPTADDVQSAVAGAVGNPWVQVHKLGDSGEGRAITLLEITDPSSTVPMDHRVVTLLETQQHGNEPAGTGAALPLLADLLAGKHSAGLLDNQILLLLPMSNPDGATANTRENHGGVDVNRDHVALVTTEARTIHEALNRWDIHVAIDHHEYSGTGLGSPVPVNLYDFDLTLMYANHGNVRRPTFDAARSLDADGLRPAARAAGYTVGDYGILTLAGIPIQQTAGGPDPGILRNSFGLNNVAGILAETFISIQPENPFQNADRRIAIHRLVMDTTLQWAHDHAAELIAAKRESERLNREEPQAEYSEIGQGQTLHGPLPAAFKVKDDLSGLFTMHGLPVAAPVDGGFVHNVHGEGRAGLVAALLHPQSSRRVADAEPTEAVPAADAQAAGASETPVGLVALAAVALALASRRR